MRISLPTFSGMKEASNEMKEVVKWLNDLAQALARFTAKGITFRDNLNHEVFVVRNVAADAAWIEVTHSLKRLPTGYMLQRGGTSAVQDAILGERSVKFLLAGYTEITIVIC